MVWIFRLKKSELSVLDEMGSAVKRQLRKVLEAPIKKNDHDTESTQLAKKYYQTCMNVKQLEKLGLAPLIALIESLGGWPILQGDKWKGEANYEWMKMAARAFREFNRNSIFLLSISPDFREDLVNVIEIRTVKLYLGDREYYFDKHDNRRLIAFRRYMLETAVQLGADRKAAERDVDDVIGFETALANLSFGKFFDDLIENGCKLNDSIKIYVYCNPYLKELTKVVKKTNKRTLANYQIWIILTEYMRNLAPSLQDNFRTYTEAITGVKKDTDRWEQCVDTAKTRLPEAVSSMYVKNYFANEQIEKVQSMVSNIRASMTELLQKTAWLDETTKRTALIKMEKMIELIAFPNYIFNETWIIRDIKGIEIDISQYFSNTVSLSKRLFREFIRSLGEQTSRTDWSLNAHDVGALYHQAFITITFPAAFLQYPFFIAYAPNYVNYARFGSAVGHEITHGFDSSGRTFNADGIQTPWWSNETSELFDNKAQCLIDQYSSIVDNATGYTINGLSGIGENIADNGGIKLAYQAYERWSSSQLSPEPILQKLGSYSAKQIFFISYGQAWCNIIRPEALKHKILTDPHTPDKYRINIPLANFDVFSETFKCPLGSIMNPTKKCTVW